MDEIDPRGSRTVVIGYPEKRAAVFSFFSVRFHDALPVVIYKTCTGLLGAAQVSVTELLRLRGMETEKKRKRKDGTDTGREVRRGVCMLRDALFFFFFFLTAAWMNFFVFAYTRLATRELKCMVDRTILNLIYRSGAGSPLSLRVPSPFPRMQVPGSVTLGGDEAMKGGNVMELTGKKKKKEAQKTVVPFHVVTRRYCR